MSRARRIDFADLFDSPGQPDMRYGPLAAALDGERVEIEGVVLGGHAEASRFLLVDRGGVCPGCSPSPVPAVCLPDLRALSGGVTPGETRVVVGAGNHGHVGLGLGLVVEGHRALHAHDPSGPEGCAERLLREPDTREMGTTLRLADDQRTPSSSIGSPG